MASKYWTPSAGLFRSSITVDPNPREIPLEAFRPETMNGIPLPLIKYMAAREAKEQTYRCSSTIEKAYRNKVTPVKYDSPLNDYIRHFPFFRRARIFPQNPGDGEIASHSTIRTWLARCKTLELWDGSISHVENTDAWVPTTLLEPFVSCRQCQKSRRPCIYTVPASLTTIRDIGTSTSGVGKVTNSFPSRPDDGPISEGTFKPIASGELGSCLGCRYQKGAKTECTFVIGNYENVRIRPLFYPRAREVTLRGSGGEVVYWNERNKYNTSNLLDLVQLDPSSVTKHGDLEVTEKEGKIGDGAEQKRARSQSPNFIHKRQRNFSTLEGSHIGAASEILDLEEDRNVARPTFNGRSFVTVTLDRPFDIPQTQWVDRTALTTGSKQSIANKAGPLDWHLHQTEFLRRLMTWNLGSFDIDRKFFRSPLVYRLGGQLDLLDHKQFGETPNNFVTDRARYLCHHERYGLAEWATGEHCPEKAIVGFLRDYNCPPRGRLVISKILASDLPLYFKASDYFPTVRGGQAVHNGHQHHSIVGIIRQSNLYYAFVISLDTPQARAIVFDPFPGQQMDIRCRNVLEALTWAVEAGKEVRCEYDGYSNTNSKTESDLSAIDSFTASQSAALALLIVQDIFKRPSTALLQITPEALGYDKSQTYGQWIGSLEERLLHRYVSQARNRFDMLRLVQEELASV